ncbi:MAG: glycosyltransferase [Nostoc sp.]|uniref:glycosyltransferase n=1 Tax=Nostoc sp. TaxID=1180 RepID=UPI002FF73384
MQPLRILRPCRSAEMISARVFDELFARNLAPDLLVEPIPLPSWCDEIFGSTACPVPLAQAAENFAHLTAKFDFFCPSYECIALTPLLLALRNLARAKVRLMFYAHAPGVYTLEWSLLRPLLKSGDIIIAGSSSAKAVIEFLCPDFAPFIRVVSPPMHLLPKIKTAAQRTDRIVSLTRITPEKLLHRQIEAMDVLRRRGYSQVKLQIAGPLTDGQSTELHPYARSLAAKIKRMQACVELVGPIYSDRHKARFISGARLMLNLSVTLEESFGKSIIESLGLGVPVLATRWNGFPETVGAGGELVSVSDLGPGLPMDVTPEQIADGMEKLLNSPPTPDICREQADQFCNPAAVKQKYRLTLEEAMDLTSCPDSVDPFPSLRAAPTAGLLSLAAPLQPFSWGELFNFHLEECDRIRRRWAGETVLGKSDSEWLRELLFVSTRKPLECFLGGLDYSAYITTTEPIPTKIGTDFLSRIVTGVAAKATLSSQLACLLVVSKTGQTKLLQEGLELLKQSNSVTPTIQYLTTELERQRGNFATAFQLCTTALDTNFWGEWAAYHLRQLARICREWNKPELALPWLRQWLEQFPDSPDSGSVWLDRCINAFSTGKDFLIEAEAALAQAKNLLGNSPTLEKVEKTLKTTTSLHLILSCNE